METIFITIHDLSLDARIKYCTDSIEDILGYKPNEVRGKSCWEYFHPDEIPFARAIHGKGLDLEKAAALNYCRIKHKDGTWVGCECVFTVVHDVLVASTSIYKRGPKAERRAVEGAAVRRVFSSSPRDPRYHMLSYISSKFTQTIQPQIREPRAALILNRYSRTSPIMFATNGVEQILGYSPMELVGKSFYYCISENCLSEAVRTVESAKGNDSIAYLRFYFRDPTLPDPPVIEHSDSDSDSDESDGGGAPLSRGSSVSMTSPSPLVDGERSVPRISVIAHDLDGTQGPRHDSADSSRMVDGESHGLHHSDSSGNSTDMDGNAADRIFDRPHFRAQSSASSFTPQETLSAPEPIEIEAVISCTSDGLVLVLRRAHPFVPETANTEQPIYPNGLFASPWATDPVLPDHLTQTTAIPNITFPPVSEPTESGFMSAIRDVAVFAWSLTGINGSIVEKAAGRGRPTGEALPPGGLPIWDPNALPGQNDCYNGFSGGTHRPIHGSGDPQFLRSDDDTSSSGDEVVWKRAPQMPTFRKPKRRAHQDAFGSEVDDSTDSGGAQVQASRRRKLENGERQNSA